MKKNKTFAAIMLAACFAFFSVSVYAQNKPELSDPEIASVSVVANQIDINAGELAKTKSKNSDVINFANTMINDHQAVINQATALAKKLNVTPKDNAVSKKLLADAANTKKMLSAKSGKAFDKAYIDNEVGYHQAVISTIKDLLIPEAQNAELKQLLQNVLPAFQTHLEHAQMIQKKLE